VVRDLLDARRRDIPSPQHVGEEGSNLIHPLRAAECDEEYGIKCTHPH
jgi:hypothetical protein